MAVGFQVRGLLGKFLDPSPSFLVAQPVGEAALLPFGEVLFGDGRILERTRWKMLGAPDMPMTEAEVHDKFRSCLKWGLDASPSSIQSLQNLVMALDESEDASGLISTFLLCSAG